MKEKLRAELHKFLLVSAYLYVCLLALLLYKAAVLSGTGVHVLSVGYAAGKALILAKFILIGEAVRLGAHQNARSVLQLILRRSILFLLLLIALSIGEEILVGLVRGHGPGQTFGEFISKGIPELLANCLMMLLVLVPLMTIMEASRAFGEGSLRRFLNSPPGTSDD
jgi:hypothetical protein